MKKENKMRTKWLTVRMNEDEYAQLRKLFHQSTCRQLSDYVRRVVAQKPVSVKYRNVSIDDFLSDMLALKKELNAIGNNFNQSVHRLYTLRLLPEMQNWVIKNEKDKETFFAKIEQMSERINELYRTWLP